MKIEHIAIWSCDMELLRSFYVTYFGAVSGEKYENTAKGFSSYFLRLGDGTCRMELMHVPDLVSSPSAPRRTGLAHLAFSVGSKDAVDRLTERIRKDGWVIVGEPRTTGDGYYESVILDPEGNTIEITI